MRFHVHPPSLAEELAKPESTYITGPDGVPWPTRVWTDDGVLMAARDVSDSGALHVAYPVAGRGRLLLSTATLMERPAGEPAYQLQVELARGKLNQVRKQQGEWEMLGLALPDEVRVLIDQAHHLFARAVTTDDLAAAASEAEAALPQALAAAEALVAAYARQSLAVRHAHYPRLVTLLGCDLGHAVPERDWSEPFYQAFNFAVVPINWQRVEPNEGEYHWQMYDTQVKWCQQHRLTMRGGPLLSFVPEGVPPWLSLWEDDFDNLTSFVRDFIETSVARYRGQIRRWEFAGHANTGELFALEEDQRLRLVVRALEAAREVDSEAEYFIAIDQPWSEYVVRGEHDLSAMHFADALVRANLGLTGIALEIEFGYRPGSWRRDLLELSRLIDRWSMLGVPLHVTVGMPSAIAPDALASPRVAIAQEWLPDGWDAEAQRAWLAASLPVLLAKPSVQAVTWAHFSDAVPHELPHAGLLDVQGRPKPALAEMIRLRREHLR